MSEKKVLIVDDVELFLELEKTFLKRETVELLVARSGLQACQIVMNERPDLVLMDLYMPEMNGDEACLLIKSKTETRHIPVIIVTQGGHREDLERCRAVGCDDIIFKPLDRELFLETARNYLGMADRTASRAAVKLAIEYGEDPVETLSDYSVNLSAGGVFLESETLLPVNTSLSLEFYLPGPDVTVRCHGRVAWVNSAALGKQPRLPNGMGIQFLDLAMDYRYAIREFIKQARVEPQW